MSKKNGAKHADSLNFGIIGNCKSAALINEDSSIDWCCLPQFDSASVFGKILDQKIGGEFKKMGKGRKRKPTKIKELQGTLKPERILDNEMTVSLVPEIPPAPNWLTEIGSVEWQKVCGELYNKRMLHQIDLRLIEAYCNANLTFLYFLITSKAA